MILQRFGARPWLETPFEVFDKGVFTQNDQHYVSWHWANFSGRHRCRQLSSDGARSGQSDAFAVAEGYFWGLPRFDIAAVNELRRAFHAIYFRAHAVAGRAMGKWFDEQRGLDRRASQGCAWTVPGVKTRRPFRSASAGPGRAGDAGPAPKFLKGSLDHRITPRRRRGDESLSP